MTEVYYLLFFSSDQWYCNYLAENCSHVAIFRKIGDKKFIKIEPRARFLEVCEFNFDLKNLDKKKYKNLKIVQIQIDREIANKNPIRWLTYIPLRWGIFNCVSIAKYILDFRGFIFTPMQLYRFLSNKHFRLNKHNRHMKLINVNVIGDNNG